MFRQNKKNKGFSLIELAVVILIIGILVAAISQGGRLVTKAKLTAAKQKTSASPLHAIQAVEIWLETSSDVSFPQSIGDGDAVTTNQWVSNNRYTAKKTLVVTNNLTYDFEVGANGVPAVNFDAAGQIAITETFLNGLTNYNIFVVANGANDDVVFSCEGGLDIRLSDESLTHITNYQVTTTAVTAYVNGGAAETMGSDNNSSVTAGAYQGACTIGETDDINLLEFVVISGSLSNDDIDEINEYLANKYKISDLSEIQ